VQWSSGINRYFTEHRMKGFAYRLKQAPFNTQYVDIVVDHSTCFLMWVCGSLTRKPTENNRLGRKPASPVRA